jgi:hypothetical protein
MWGFQRLGDYMWLDNNHAHFAFPTIFLVTFVAFGGFMSRFLLNKLRWNTQSAIRFKWCHRWLAYIVMCSGFMAVFFGIKDLNDDPKTGLMNLHLIQFGITSILVFLSEFAFEWYNSEEKPFLPEDVQDVVITVREFKKRVQYGE